MTTKPVVLIILKAILDTGTEATSTKEPEKSTNLIGRIAKQGKQKQGNQH